MSLIGLVFSFIDSLVNNILVVFNLKSVAIPPQDMHLINVRYGKQNQTFVLNLTPDMKVEDVKKQLVDKIGVHLWSDIVIIFSGKELPNDLQLSDCDFGQNSIIHAINSLNVKTRTNLQPFSQTSINEKLTNLDINDTSEEFRSELSERAPKTSDTQQKCYFFVFCNSCKKLMNGKLRVVCNICKNGTIVLDRDPKEWDDVLIPNRISGVCQSDECNGSSARFYFKCTSRLHSSSEDFEDNRAVVLYLIRHNSIDVTCLVCMEIRETVLVFPCASKHVICLECFEQYCISRLNERRFIIDPQIGYSLNCPIGCPESLIQETHHFKLMPESDYQKYQRFAAEECVLSCGGLLCPQPGCGAGIIIEESDPDICNRITCGSCGFVFCRKCLQGFHIGDCLTEEATDAMVPSTSTFLGVDPTNADQSKWDDMLTRTAIKLSTKPCPKCRTPTERNGGCMHIVCTRSQCGFNWCWICQTEWNRDCMGNHWFG